MVMRMSKNVFKGVGVTKLVGVGEAIVLGNYNVIVKRVKAVDAQAEYKRFLDARSKFIDNTNTIFDDLKSRIDNAEVALVIRNHIAIVNDVQFENDIKREIIDNKLCAQWAVEVVCDSYISLFSQMDNEVLAQRTADFEDIKSRLICILHSMENGKSEDILIGKLQDDWKKEYVLVAKELQPSVTAALDVSKIAGIVVENGCETSHVAILARALDVPTVIGVKGLVENVTDGDMVVVDGDAGEVVLKPDSETIEAAIVKKNELQNHKAALDIYKDKEACMKDGERVLLHANIGSVEEAEKVKECGADGIGLFRTEFIFMNGDRVPTMEEQYQIYSDVVRINEGRDLTIRTLDIGGDKEVPSLRLEKEINPFLGLRGVRLCLEKREILKTQIEAILRASVYSNGNLRIMVPMITNVSELREVRAIVDEVKDYLKAQSITYDDSIKVGIMVETPAAVMMADVLAKEADFFSIGTNDLTQYTMAVDRGNEKVAYLFDALEPSVLRAVKHIVKVADEAGIEVSVCGEAAADPLILPILLGIGVKKFSVASSLILDTKKNLAEWDVETVKAIADNVLKMTSAEEIREYVNSL